MTREDIKFLLEKLEEYKKGNSKQTITDLLGREIMAFIVWVEEGLPLEEIKEEVETPKVA